MKTSVRKYGNTWVVTYYARGKRYTEAKSWDDAMDIACSIEKNRAWV